MFVWFFAFLLLISLLLILLQFSLVTLWLFPVVLLILVGLWVYERNSQITVIDLSKPGNEINFWTSNFFPDISVNEKLLPVIKQYFPDVNIKDVEFTDVIVNKEGDLQTKFYILNKNNNSWNPTQKYYFLSATSDGSDSFTATELHDMNTVDRGMIEPTNSDDAYDLTARSRKWNDQQQKWKMYKRDWDVTWSDQPIR